MLLGIGQVKYKSLNLRCMKIELKWSEQIYLGWIIFDSSYPFDESTSVNIDVWIYALCKIKPGNESVQYWQITETIALNFSADSVTASSLFSLNPGRHVAHVTPLDDPTAFKV